MSKRRPSGDGMVRKREDGRWEGRIVVGHKENGEPIFRYVLARTQKGTAGQAPPGHGPLSGRAAHRGQPHDPGRVAGPLDGGIRCRHPASQHPAQLRAVHPVLRKALLGRQDRLPRHSAGYPKAVPETEERGPGPRPPGVWTRAVGQHGAPHPRHAPPVSQRCGAGPHRPLQSNGRCPSCPRAATSQSRSWTGSRWTPSWRQWTKTKPGGTSSTRS